MNDDAKPLADELAARLGREQGEALLKRARNLLVLNASRTGSATTEFRMSVLAILGGLSLCVLGAVQDQPDLLDQGVDLVKWSVTGYAVSRGVAKVGASKVSDKDA